MPSVRFVKPVGRADVRDVVELGALDLRADADDRPARVERLRQQLDHRGAPLEQPEQAVAGFELVCRAASPSSPAAPPTKSCVPGSASSSTNAGRDRRETPLAPRQLGVLELPPEQARPELDTGDALVQELPRPRDETRVDGIARSRTAASSPRPSR